jgi:plasmid stability protein
MATLTIRNLPDEVADRLRQLASRNGYSMEEQVRRLLTERVMDRASALEQIERAVARQSRPTTAEEIDAALENGRR